MRVKICGITRTDEALFALDNGADFFGLVFYPKSPRFVTLSRALGIINSLREKGYPAPPAIGVFVDEDLNLVKDYAETLGLFAVQLHGAESPDYCREIPRPVIKAIRVKRPESLHIIGEYDVWAYLCDAWHPDFPGGTGKSIDASILSPYIQTHRIFLAGGLTPDNILGILKDIKPFAVDVSTGVETSPGIKDPEKVKAFIRAAKSFD